jgi:predicted dehydrogenase
MARPPALSRRRFFQAAGSLGAAAFVCPAFVPARALGAEGTQPANERIAVGMIGVGRQAFMTNMKQFLSMPDVQLVAVCDVDSWRRDNAKRAIEKEYSKRSQAGTYRGCDAYVDYEELLARKDIDAVMISTPDHWHAPMALAAMKAGKDVSLEKPITRTIAEGRQLSDAAAKLKRVFRVDSELRSTPGVHRAAELVRNGRIGKVRKVTVGVPLGDVGCPPQSEMPVPGELDYDRWQGPAPRAPYTEKRVHPPKSYERPGWMRHLFYCDGMITNWGAHLDDGAMWCTGLERTGPVEIWGTGQYPAADSFWNVLLNFEVNYRFADGLEWTYRTEKPYFRIEGTEGWVLADFNSIQSEPASLLTAQIGPSEIHFPRKTDKQDFIDSVKSRQDTLEPAEVGHRVTSLCHLGHIAIHLGEKLQWDPEVERFRENDAANAYIDKPIHEPRRAT